MKLLSSVAILAALLSWSGSPALGFRFVCNSVDSAGTPNSDVCGPCNVDVAARWPDASARLTVFSAALPVGLTASQWAGRIEEGGARWTEVDGCRFAYSTVAAGQEATPSWGVEDGENHVFWVQGDPEDWQNLTLTNPATTIALSAVQYVCNSGGAPRLIYDADVVFNDAGPKWQCDEPECWSLDHAVTHELGHALGLGHGCPQCTTSMMVALADPAFQPEALFDDDRAGCAALYPVLPEAPPDAPTDDAPDSAPDVAVDMAQDDGGSTGCHGGVTPGALDLSVAAMVAWLFLARLRGCRCQPPGSPLDSPTAR